MRKRISSYALGDMKLIYQQGVDRKGNECVGMLLVPEKMSDKVLDDKVYDVEPLVQMKIIGDDYPFNYSQGRTMRGSQTGLKLKYTDQTVRENDSKTTIITTLKDDRGLVAEHMLTYNKGDFACFVQTKIINYVGESVFMEMLSSFTMGGLTPFETGVAPETMILHQIKSTWANEGRLVSRPIEEFQLEPSWKPSGANGIRFGQIGSMPNREYFPFVGIEDKKNKVCFGAELSIGSSWQMEAYRKDDGLSISGGIADREKGHWVKKLNPRESFVTPKAILSTVCGDMDLLCQRLTKTKENHIGIKECEKEMPIIFNEFCTTWGHPDETLMKKLVDVTAEHGIKYFVVDDGWFNNGNNTDNQDIPGHGDWICNRKSFPNGMKSLTRYIHEKNMKAGIWYEMETCGRNSLMFNKTDMLYKRDGYPITAGHRRFLNMMSGKVWEYLDEKLLYFLKYNDFDYLKIDYNANLGLGPDGEESLGAGLYDGVLETQDYIKHLSEKMPELIIENCAAGGHRLVDSFTEITDMSSYSDAHECMNIPIVAANVHRMIPVRQSQIWAVLHPEFTDRMMFYKLTSTFLGRMCISGDVLGLSERQWKIVDLAIEFYNMCKDVIANGVSQIELHIGLSYKEPKGYQIVKRKYENKMLVIVHTFEDCPKTIEVPVNDYRLKKSCVSNDVDIKCVDNKVILNCVKSFDGIAFLLEV